MTLFSEYSIAFRELGNLFLVLPGRNFLEVE
jgi:hypothetical protein